MYILIVDDSPFNLTLFSGILKELPSLSIVTELDPIAALERCRQGEPDLVLVDYSMPGMNGVEFLQAFRALPGKSHVPLIMATSEQDFDLRLQALQMTATDFVLKPINRIELTARVRNLLDLRRAHLQLAQRAQWLTDEVKKATREVRDRERELINRLSMATDYRDPETGMHVLRLAHYARLVAANLGLSDAEQELIFDAAPKHDVGKVAIPDYILLKPGPLDEREMAIMRTHAEIGYDILKGSPSPLLQAAAVVSLTHHEKYDGTGYSNRLKGEAIPLYGRIIAIADVYDALTSERPYKQAWEPARAMRYIAEQAGKHFDPACVEALLRHPQELEAIRLQFTDELMSDV